MRNDHDDQSVLQLVAARISQTPDAVAVEYDDESLTYAELGRRTDLLASRIQSEGAGSDVLVGICVQRSLNMPLGILGILKAGAAYVPLDPNYPPERLGNMVADARLKILLTESEFVERFSNFSIPVLRVDVSGDRSSGERFLNSEPDFNPDRLAYVIYTSGSTGKPKGVAMPYSPLDRLIRWQVAQAVPAGPVVTSQFASMSFDVSFQEIFSTWCTGGKLVVVPDSARQDPRRLARLLIEKQIVRSFLPPVVLQHLAKICDEENCWPTSLREVIAAGEQLRITQPLARFLDYLPACVLQNHYGPTESHVVTAGVVGKVGREWPELPSIGRSIPSASLYLLNDHLKPVPAGDTGELYLGGECLARGYHDQPDLTADRFLPDPFSGVAGSRMYWTGDVARLREDGTWECLGRNDHQVKIRGFRIELSEVEATLEQFPEVRQAVVVAREAGNDGKLLAAYFVPQGPHVPASAALRQFLKSKLPDYMIPAEFMALDSIPLTPNGKIDRLNLPAPGPRRNSADSPICAPRDELEIRLAGIFERILETRPIGIHDNVFDLGAHSLTVARLTAEIDKEFEEQLPVGAVLQAPTIAQLSVLLQRNQPDRRLTSLVSIQPQGHRPPLFCVHGGAGTAVIFQKFARHFGSDQPIYALQMHGVYTAARPHSRVEDMAAHYIQEIRVVQPRGPYAIAGYCFGATVAFEMACQLHGQGEEISALIALNGAAPNCGALTTNADEELLADDDEIGSSRRRSQTAPHRTSLMKRVARGCAWRLNGFRAWMVAVRRRITLLFGLVLPDVVRREHFLKITAAAEASYALRKYPGKLHLFRSKEVFADPSAGWDQWVQGGVEVYEAPFEDERLGTLLTGQNAPLIAMELSACLARQLPPDDVSTESEELAARDLRGRGHEVLVQSQT